MHPRRRSAQRNFNSPIPDFGNNETGPSPVRRVHARSRRFRPSPGFGIHCARQNSAGHEIETYRRHRSPLVPASKLKTRPVARCLSVSEFSQLLAPFFHQRGAQTEACDYSVGHPFVAGYTAQTTWQCTQVVGQRKKAVVGGVRFLRLSKFVPDKIPRHRAGFSCKVFKSLNKFI